MRRESIIPAQAGIEFFTRHGNREAMRDAAPDWGSDRHLPHPPIRLRQLPPRAGEGNKADPGCVSVDRARVAVQAEMPRRYWLGHCGLAAFALLLASGPFSAAVAANDACASQTLRGLADAGLVPEHALLAAQACRIWPFDPSLALAAVAHVLPGDAELGERQLRLTVAVLDAANAQPLAVHQTDLAEDAVLALEEGALRLDTARYDLAPGVRAFGVVVHSSARGASCPDAGFNDELTLYMREGSGLKPVFSTYLDTWQRVVGEPCNWREDTRLVTESAALTIGVEPGRHHGLADLRVMADVTRTDKPAGEDFDGAVQTHRRVSRVVRYDGNGYDTRVLHNGLFWASTPVDE